LIACTTQELEEFKWFCKESRAPLRRSLRQFAQEEIIIPTGPYGGKRLTIARQPLAGLYWDEIDSGRWNRSFSTGCVQSGKTLVTLVVPTLYHLFELGEDVILGMPDLNMANDKWSRDFEPVIQRTRYKDMMPTEGAGSRGGKVIAIKFKNGTELRFMSGSSTGGGGDKKRAGFTSRVVAVTEVDGFAKVSASSDETDPVSQIEARTKAYDINKMVYGECTLTTETGRTYREIKQGTSSRIVLRCTYCQAWVTPEKEHFVGWEDADTELQAESMGTWHCPACGAKWTEEDRHLSNIHGKLVHRGQEVDERGAIYGPVPETRTLGFRWSAVNNLLVSARGLSSELWRLKHGLGLAEDYQSEDAAERYICQYIFAIPYKPAKTETVSLDVDQIMRRARELGRGLVPSGTRSVTVGVDIQKFSMYWLAIAWGEGATGRIIDYGVIPVFTLEWGEEQAIQMALREIQVKCEAGWQETGGAAWRPEQVWIDSGFENEAVYKFARPAGERYRPMKGWGTSKDPERGGRYMKPTALSDKIAGIGDAYHFAWQAEWGMYLVHIDADHWKTFIHRRLAQPVDGVGALTLCAGEMNEHKRLALHMTAERQMEEFIPEKGKIVRWIRERKDNHWLDCGYVACAAAHWCGIRLIGAGPDQEQMDVNEWFKKQGGR
jgi:phage terminase large subunit GpA-like protein